MRKAHLKKTIFLSLCIFAAAHSTCLAASQAKKSIKEANRLYQKGKLDAALQKYNDLSVALADSDIINFNMGAALYKKEDYQKAQEAFTKALISDNKKLEADALYNLGNCKYRLGKLKENTDLSATVAHLRESLDYYKRAVEIDQKNTDARFNHEFVERELKVLLDKLKQQEQESQGTCPTDKEQAKDEKGKEQSSQAQDQQQQEKGEEGRGESPPEERRQEEGEARREEFQQEEENKELSEEAARTLLERYGREETRPDYRSEQTQRGYDSQVSKDW